MKTLHLCYFGIREPLVQAQVLPYLRALARSGIGTHLLTFEAAGARGCHAASERRAMRARLAADGITWHRLRYHQRPAVPATLYDAAAGIARASWLVRRHGIDVAHARSHVPALMALALQRGLGCRFLFDFRGLMADESVEAGRWSRDSRRFRVMKRLERVLLREADAVVMLTEQIRQHFFDDDGRPLDEGVPGRARPIAVIPCCVDLARFQGARGRRDALRRELDLGNGTVLVHLGSLGGYYMTEELAALTAAALRVDPDVRLLALSRDGHTLLRNALRACGVPEHAFRVLSADPQDVPALLGTADIGISLRQPGLATMACSPTKVAEYLAVGLPVISNAGVGDTERVLRQADVGVLLEALTPDAMADAVCKLQARLSDAAMESRCIAAARRWFDLETVGGPAYVRLYAELMATERDRKRSSSALAEAAPLEHSP
jgi:glycosyltransferase involved in cell wall biosynthesis